MLQFLVINASKSWIRVRTKLKYWIQISIETNSDPQHCFGLSFTALLFKATVYIPVWIHILIKDDILGFYHLAPM